jgi:hypothetical protein
MTKRPAEPEKPWRELLSESFDFVQAEGGLFELDLEYYTDRKRKRAVVTGCCGSTVLPRKPRLAAYCATKVEFCGPDPSLRQ